MRIAIDGKVLNNTQITGVGRYTLNLLDAFSKIDKENEWFLFVDENILRKKESLNFGPNFKMLDNIGIRGSYTFLDEAFDQILLKKKLKGEKIDVYFSPHFTLPLLCNFPKVVVIHDLIPLFSQFRFKKLRRFHFWTKLSTKDADRIIAISSWTKRDIIKYWKIPEDKIKVIYHGIDNNFCQIEDRRLLEECRIRYKLPTDFILYVGCIEPRKNLSNLIKAYANIKKEFPHKLVLIGPLGWMYEDIFRTINQLNLEEDVILLGYVPDRDLVSIYNLSSLFVFPSFYEGFGLPVLEAMVCGVPVITSNTSSLPEVAGDAAILIDPYNVKELSFAMRKVLSDDSLKEEMKEKGLKQVSKFSWKKAAYETLEVLKEVVDKKRRYQRRYFSKEGEELFSKKISSPSSLNYFNTLKNKEIKNILIVRSCRMEQFESSLRIFKETFKDANFSVLVQTEIEKIFKERDEFSCIFILPKGMFRIYKIRLSLLKELRKKRFDLFVVLYNNPTGYGYFHFELFSFLIRAKDRIGCSIDGRVYKINFWKCLKKEIRFALTPFILIYILLAFQLKEVNRFYSSIKHLFKRSKGRIVNEKSPN